MSRLNWTPEGRVPLPCGTSAQRFTRGPLNVLVAQEEGRWHLSVSTPSRYPTWDEIADARYDLLPDGIQVAMMLPPRAQYVNVHPYVFHLWESRDTGIPTEEGDAAGQARTRDGVPA